MSGYAYIRQLPTKFFYISGQISSTDKKIRRRIMHYSHGREPREIGFWVKVERDLLLRKLKEEGLSICQIERVTGIPRGVVGKVDKIGTSPSVFIF